jgi:hypothetical protein
MSPFDAVSTRSKVNGAYFEGTVDSCTLHPESRVLGPESRGHGPEATPVFLPGHQYFFRAPPVFLLGSREVSSGLTRSTSSGLTRSFFWAHEKHQYFFWAHEKLLLGSREALLLGSSSGLTRSFFWAHEKHQYFFWAHEKLLLGSREHFFWAHFFWALLLGSREVSSGLGQPGPRVARAPGSHGPAVRLLHEYRPARGPSTYW